MNGNSLGVVLSPGRSAGAERSEDGTSEQATWSGNQTGRCSDIGVSRGKSCKRLIARWPLQAVWPRFSVARIASVDQPLLISELAVDTREQSQFETLLQDLLASFVGLRAHQVDDAIVSAQRGICESLGIEHSAVWQGSPREPGLYLLTHLYRDPRLPSVPDRLDGNTYFPWTQQKLRNKEILTVPDVLETSPEAHVDKRSWLAYGIRSVLAFPLWIGDDPIFGALAFEATSKPRDWHPAVVKKLQLVAQIITNVLAQKLYEQALIEGEWRLRFAANCAGAGLWTLDSASGYIWATEMNKKLLGFAPTDEVNVTQFLNRVHPDDRDTVKQVLDDAMTSGEESGIEYRIVRPDGQIRWIFSRGSRHCGVGAPNQLMGVSIDVTDRKQADQELQKSYAEIKELKDKLEAEGEYLQEEIQHIGGHAEIVGGSAALAQVLRRVQQVAETDTVVLITGETGTGKELIARAIHKLSKRKDRVMLKVDCTALPPTLVESELFGREKGAYTGALSRQAGRFEVADGSTLFLDEVGDLGLEAQAKLLRVVQDGEFERLGSTRTTRVDVRLIAATHRNLAERVENGTFREDLFYRLNVFPIHVPPLRERLEDIPLLTMAFVREFEKRMGKKIRIIPKTVMEELRDHAWPGNIRELRNIIERAIIITNGEKLRIEMPKPTPVATMRTLKETEFQHIRSALTKTGWRIKGPHGAAQLLGMKASTLYAAMHRLHIPTRHERETNLS